MKKEELQEFLNKNGVRLIVGAYGEGPGCEGLVEKVFENKDGQFTKFIGCSYLFKGYPDTNVVNWLAGAKKIIATIARYLNTWRGKVFILSVMLSPKRNEVIFDIFTSYTFVSHCFIKPFLFPIEKCCVSVREIYRAFNVISEKHFLKGNKDIIRKEKIIKRFIEIVAMILQFDAAYKWRLQDILGEVDRRKLERNAMEEIQRIFNIFKDRENTLKAMVRYFWGILFILKINKGLKQIFVDFIMELDLEKVSLDEADRYFCLKRHTYNFWGASIDERKSLWDKTNKEKGHEIPNIVQKIVEK